MKVGLSRPQKEILSAWGASHSSVWVCLVKFSVEVGLHVHVCVA